MNVARLAAVCIVLAPLLLAQENAQQPPAQTQPRTAPEKPAPAADNFSEAVAERVLNDLRDGLVGQSQRRTLAVFDRAQMPDYEEFSGDMAVLFEEYESFRVRYRIGQTTAENGRGVATVDFTLEATPLSTTAPPLHRSAQLRFEFARSGKTWKIVDVKPRSFFE